MKADTDGDTLIDGDDVALGFDPTLPDTDFNGILDCDEKTKQTLTLYVDDDTNPIESVTVSFKGTGNINKNTSITDIKGKDVLCSNVVGLVEIRMISTLPHNLMKQNSALKSEKISWCNCI